jgi:hypothetical protein
MSGPGRCLTVRFHLMLDSGLIAALRQLINQAVGSSSVADVGDRSGAPRGATSMRAPGGRMLGGNNELDDAGPPVSPGGDVRRALGLHPGATPLRNVCLSLTIRKRGWILGLFSN